MLRLLVTLYRFVMFPYHYVVRPKRLGAHCIVLDEGGRVLLVRHTYCPGWYFPGGGVKRRETLEKAARREVFEETGVTPEGPIELFGVYSAISRRYSDHMVLYVIRNWRRKKRWSFEIAETDFFPLDDIPADTAAFVRGRIEELRERMETSV